MNPHVVLQHQRNTMIMHVKCWMMKGVISSFFFHEVTDQKYLDMTENFVDDHITLHALTHLQDST